MKKPKKSNIVKIIISTVFAVLTIGFAALVAIWLFFPYSMPIGGAKDTDGDGKIDMFWDGHSEKMSNFERWFQ